MKGSTIQNKYIKFGGISLVFILAVYIIFQFTESVYNQHSASIHISSMKQFLVTYNPNVCAGYEKTKFCKDYESDIYYIFSKYVISKEYASLKTKKEILNSILLITHTNPDSILAEILVGFPKDTFKEEVTLID